MGNDLENQNANDRFSEEETAKRRDEAICSTLSTPSTGHGTAPSKKPAPLKPKSRVKFGSIYEERRLGECIRVQKETVGLNPGGWKERKAQTCGSDEEPQERAPTLADAGIDKKLSSRAQKLAARARGQR